MNKRNFLIPPQQVDVEPCFKTWRSEFNLAGFIKVTPYTDQNSDVIHNRFCAIATEAAILHGSTQLMSDSFVLDLKVEFLPAFVVPVFMNNEPTTVLFSSEHDLSVNARLPFIAFFRGNEDRHYALRYATAKMRQQALEFFGEDLGFFEKDLIEHN